MDFHLPWPDAYPYNITQPVGQMLDGVSNRYLLARIERKDRTGKPVPQSSMVKFCRETITPEGKTVWVVDDDRRLAFLPEVVVDDGSNPFDREAYEDGAMDIGTLDGKPHVKINVTKAWIEKEPKEGEEPDWRYHQLFFEGEDISNLVETTPYPLHPALQQRKGTRQGTDNTSLHIVLNRPRGGADGLFFAGRICYNAFRATTTTEYRQRFPEALLNTQVAIPGLADTGEPWWWGPGPIEIFPDGTIGVIGHIARYIGGTSMREYCGVALVYDPGTNTTTDLEIIATKASWERIGEREPNSIVHQVFYPTGTELLEDGRTNRVYGGVADCAAGYVDVEIESFIRRRVFNPQQLRRLTNGTRTLAVGFE